MDQILEAFLNGECKLENYVSAAFGLIKIGDLVSDCFFIGSLNENLDKIDFDDTPYYISAIAFTIIGILFDMYKACYYLKRRFCKNAACCCSCRAKEDHPEQETENVEDNKENEQKEDWKSWKSLNLFFEEIPQLIILIFYFIEIHDQCYYYGCNEELYTETGNSALVSTIFTVMMLCTHIFMWVKHCRRNNKCCWS
jgi:hypothetical protein